MQQIVPSFRWAGSKAKLTSELFDKFTGSETYIEPFLGSGVVLFRLLQQKRYKRYIVNDINVSIISFYRAVQKDCELVIKGLNRMKDSYNNSLDKEALYYRIRDKFNEDKSNFFLFWLLMKTCFNGLYRENRKGNYNVSFGRKKKINFDEDMLRETARLIQGVEFHNMDFHDFYDMVDLNEETFLYGDPPYVNSDQTYSSGGFNNKALADTLEKAEHFVAISDVDSEASRLTYGAFKKNYIKEQKRVINITSITKKVEVLYTNY